MANLTKSEPFFEVEVAQAEGLTVYGGLVALDALARQYGLWEKLRALKGLDLRTNTAHGFSPEVLVAQLVFSLCSGGTGLSDAEKLGRDKTLAPLLGIRRGADASTIGEWLRGQSEESVARFQEVVRGFVDWVLEQAAPERVRRDGTLEVFIDDTQIEVHGGYFEGAKINYNGDLALSWQTFWVGPFLTAGVFGPGSGEKGEEVSEQLPALMEQCRGLWEDAARAGTAHFYADSGSSAGKYLRLIDAEPWGWSVSYNKFKGDRERGFSELLSDLDLHHPPCQSLAANRMFYSIGMLAYDLLIAFRVLCLDEASQGLRARSLVRHLMATPLKLVRHACRVKARLLCPLNWLRWWRLFIAKTFPKRPRGRPAKRRGGVPSG